MTSTNDLKVPFGLRDGRLYEPMEVENGHRCGCRCPDPECNEPLSARHPKIAQRRPHFAHQRGGISCHGIESAIHKMGKEVLAAGKAMKLPDYEKYPQYTDATGYIWRDRNGVVRRFNQVQYGTVILEEEVLPGVRPDAQVHVGWDKPLLVEIRVTHTGTDERNAALRAAGYCVVEIDLSYLLHNPTVDREMISEAVHESAGRIWLVHPELDQATEAAQKQLEDSVWKSAMLPPASLHNLEAVSVVEADPHKKKFPPDFWLSTISHNHPSLSDLFVLHVTRQIPSAGSVFAPHYKFWQASVFHLLMTTPKFTLEYLIEETFNRFGIRSKHTGSELKGTKAGEAVRDYMVFLWRAGIVYFCDESSNFYSMFSVPDDLETWIEWSLIQNHGVVFTDRGFRRQQLAKLKAQRSREIYESAKSVESLVDEDYARCHTCGLYWSTPTNSCPFCEIGEQVSVKSAPVVATWGIEHDDAEMTWRVLRAPRIKIK